MRYRWLTLIALASLIPACAETFGGGDGGPPGGDATFEAGVTTCKDPSGDWDKDGILDGEEGCVTQRDSDSDGTPDWQDFDSDDDGIPDETEKGVKNAQGKCASTKAPKNSFPCDTDGDGYPDYVDVDSDGDGIDDKDEDYNGDGLLGCCLAQCGKPGSKQAKDCILTKDGCGTGQKCTNGKCVPGKAFACSNGETSPRLKDTYGDGKLDSERGTFICRDASEDKPQGRKPIQPVKNVFGDWHIAIEKTAKYGELKITGAGSKMAAAVIQQEAKSAEVAGFVVSRDTTTANIQEELTAILAAIRSRTPGGSGKVIIRASGSQTKSHDRYDTVKGTIIDIEVNSPSNVSTMRNELVGALLGKQMAQLGNLPSAFGSSHKRFILRFVTLRRFAFKKDSNGDTLKDKNGDPIDNGDRSKWRLLIMGAIASRDNYQDPARKTGFIVDDLSNGTALATSADSVKDECDVGTIEKLPVADIIWVIDESGSMNDNRQDIVNNANNFFSRALASGLDFRMGVTNVCNPNGSYKYAIGKFCSKISSTSSDDGGVDRFLQSTEQATFSSCIKNPPGYEGGSEYGLLNAEEAVKKHLPRSTNDPAKIRTQASVAIIVATDEIPQGLSGAISGNRRKCSLGSAQGAVNAAVKKYIDLFTGSTDPEAQATFHVIGGVCSGSCSADVAHGYKEVAQALGGQWGDVCQKDLGNTLQVIIDSIVGAASPVVLEYVPISASLAVALDGLQLKRSRTNGFDYRGANNSVALINVKFTKGSELIASYKRWTKQIALK